jgi:FdhD protein
VTKRQRSVPTATRLVWQRREGRLARRPDELAIEEPLEIRVALHAKSTLEVVTVTMRTPGHDFELAAGFLFAEGVLSGPQDLASIRYCTDSSLDGEQRYNVVTVELTRGATERLQREGGLNRRLTTTSSSCGVCGSASIEAVLGTVVSVAAPLPERAGKCFDLDQVLNWPSLLREHGQDGFAATGGLHAAGLIDAEGQLLVAREDIGRHNAVDKVAGWAIEQCLQGRMAMPCTAAGMVVSGRTSFEIVQKALRMGVPLLVGVSAASSLAVRLADEMGLGLAGFVRDGTCTIYSHPELFSKAVAATS